jgi:hypothetical protein
MDTAGYKGASGRITYLDSHAFKKLKSALK